MNENKVYSIQKNNQANISGIGCEVKAESSYLYPAIFLAGFFSCLCLSFMCILLTDKILGDVMNIDNMGQATSTLVTQRPTTQTPLPLLKTANDLPKVALQLIPSIPQATGNIGNNINVSV